MRDEAVGMVLLHQVPIALAYRLARRIAADAQHQIGIALARQRVPREDRAEMRFRNMEYFGDAMEIGDLALMHDAVGGGDEQEPVNDILQQRAVRLARTAQAGDLARIAFEAGDILPGEVVEPG